jgi:hypothetical protein
VAVAEAGGEVVAQGNATDNKEDSLADMIDRTLEKEFPQSEGEQGDRGAWIWSWHSADLFLHVTIPLSGHAIPLLLTLNLSNPRLLKPRFCVETCASLYWCCLPASNLTQVISFRFVVCCALPSNASLRMLVLLNYFWGCGGSMYNELGMGNNS